MDFPRKTSDFDFRYPDDLVALHPSRGKSRVMWVAADGRPQEVSWLQFLELFKKNDVLVVNETKVLEARVFAEEGMEILFIERLAQDSGSGFRSGSGESVQRSLAMDAALNDLNLNAPERWQVLCPARQWPKGQSLTLPEGVKVNLIQTGLPQVVEVSKPLDRAYFARVGNLPLPPYIQKLRNQRKMEPSDKVDYQTVFAKNEGSLAAPTASLHFSQEDLKVLETKGVQIVKVTLHVGLGTFLPIHTEDLSQHVMHKERFEIAAGAATKIQRAKEKGHTVWALGTTVTRTLETWAKETAMSPLGMVGESELFITPGFKFQVVDRLCTNFHQPRTTLMALVAAFAGFDTVLNAYRWAIEKEFRLFSYGDLTVWEMRP